MITAEVGGAVGEARELETSADVEELVRAYGNCAMAGAPGTALAIAFDRATGFVGGSSAAARSSELLDRLEMAMARCDAEIAYQASIDAFVLDTPEAMEMSEQGGLMPAPGQQLVFGDRSLLEE